ETFLDRAHGMIGMAERRQQDRDDIDEDEAAILSEALARSLRGFVSVNRLKEIRNSFPRTGSPKNAIWFAAIAPIAKMKVISFRETREIDYPGILSTVIEKAQK